MTICTKSFLNTDLCKELLAETFQLFYNYNKNSFDVIPKFLINLILNVHIFITFPIDFGSKEMTACQYIAQSLLDIINGYGPTIPSDYEMPDEKTLARTILVWIDDTESCFFEIDIDNFNIDPILAELH